MPTLTTLQSPLAEPSTSSSTLSSTCSTTTSQPSTLTTPTSSSNESHTCPYKTCRKSFSKKYNLKAHLRLHTGEQPFECERPDCRKKFKWRSSLSSHSVWHSRKDKATTPSSVEKRAGVVLKSPSPMPKCQKLPSPKKDVRKKQAVVAKGGPIQQQAQQQQAAPTRPVPVPGVVDSTVAHNKKKRPRTENSRPRSSSKRQCAGLSIPPPYQNGPQGGDQVGNGAFETGCISTSVSCVALNEVCKMEPLQVCTDNLFDYSVKKPKLDSMAHSEPSECVTGMDAESLQLTVEECISPGSPVTTSDSGLSEAGLDLDMFPVDMFGALGNDELQVDGDGMDLFGFGGDGLDTRFGPFDLENLNHFCA